MTKEVAQRLADDVGQLKGSGGYGFTVATVKEPSKESYCVEVRADQLDGGSVLAILGSALRHGARASFFLRSSVVRLT